MSGALARLAGDKNTRHLVVVLSGHALRLTLGLISSALLARALGPAGLSVFSVLGAAMAIALTLADLGLSASAVRHIAHRAPQHLDEAQQFATAFAWLKAAGSAVALLLMVLLAPVLTRLLHLPPADGPALLWLAGLGVLATTFSGIVSTILQALQRFSALILSQSLNIALTVAAMGALFLAGRLTLWSALGVGIVTALATALLGLALTPPPWRTLPRALRRLPRRSDPALSPLLRFGRWLWLAALLTILLTQLDLLLVNHLTDPEAAGHYALALNLALKADILNQTLVTILLPAVSMLATRAEMGAYLRRSLRHTLPLACLLLLALPLAHPFTHLVYGAAYAPAVPLFHLLLAVTILDLLLTPLLLLPYPLALPHLLASATAISVGVMLLGGLVLIPALGPQGAILAKLAAKLAGAAFLVPLLLRHLRRLG